jgi:hypothetical protein
MIQVNNFQIHNSVDKMEESFRHIGKYKMVSINNNRLIFKKKKQ